MASDKPRRFPTLLNLLRKLKAGALAKAQYDAFREGHFRGALKAAYIKSFEFAQYCNHLMPDHPEEGAFFASSTLRGICEDLIVLKFIRLLPRPQRDEVIGIEMMLAVRKATSAQAKFFSEVRPFQPVVQGVNRATLRSPASFATQSVLPKTSADHDKERLTIIGQSSGLWRTEGKLPPIEQMANKVGLRTVYDYFYRIASDTVHFNPRIGLRLGWGPTPSQITFATKNFSPYYLEFCQIYSVFLFALMCRTFRRDLALNRTFMKHVKAISTELDGITRWPEAVTFEEMNDRGPGQLERTLLKIAHDNKAKKRAKTLSNQQ